MTRAFLKFTEAGHQVDIASPKGGEVMFDTDSDPRTPGGAYADDLIGLGFVHHAKFGALLKNTLPISAVSVDDYDAVWVAGVGGPPLTFRDKTALHALITAFYEKGKIVTLICQGSLAAALDPPVPRQAVGRRQDMDGLHRRGGRGGQHRLRHDTERLHDPERGGGHRRHELSMP